MNFKSGRGIGSGLFLKLGCAASLLIVLVLLPLTGRSQDDGEHAPTGQVQLVIRSGWQSETVNSMVKRNLTSAMRATTARRRSKELLLRSVTHNIMILAHD